MWSEPSPISPIFTIGGEYFRDELNSALKILQAGDISPGLMRGSWAGAMGQPQFMPSSYLDYAVDFDGHGRRDIWTNAPDTIGSIANYFHKHGWAPDLIWGLEVTLPPNFRLSSSDFLPGATFESFVRRGGPNGARPCHSPQHPHATADARRLERAYVFNYG